MKLPADFVERIMCSRTLLSDLEELVDCGGRLAGSKGEERCRRWLIQRLTGVGSLVVREHVFQYSGWRRGSTQLLKLGASNECLPCHSLLLSPDTASGGLEADVVDVGRGTDSEFDMLRGSLKGRVAIVEHEYPFSLDSIHRRIKYNRACEAGCVGFIIANNLPDGGLVTGSSGQGSPQDIPAIGVTYDVRQRLVGHEAETSRIRLDLKSTRFPAEGRNIIVDIPGHGPETVVVCAHYDGHDLAESAMDNATGVAAALQVLESLMPHSSAFRRNLRVIFFTTEEWRLLGSRSYIGTLTVDELRNICIVINLDTLAGSPDLVALTSGFDDLGEFVRRVCSSLDRTIPVIPKVMANSDHFTFSSQGVPAIRLVAGFEKPADRTKYLLTEGDTREKIEPTEFKLATLTALAMVWEALTQNDRPKHKPIDQTA